MESKWIKANGQTEFVVPENGTDFELKELQKFVGGYIEIVGLPGTNNIIVLNEEGKIKDLPRNPEATEIWRKYNHRDYIAGNVLLCDRKLVK
jgi:hypothetical protein